MTQASLHPPETKRGPAIRRAALWLAFLAPFFYLTYGGANWLASLRSDVPNLAFGWERHIPFLGWTILPYWSINAFYAFCLFVNATPKDVDRLGRRYLTIQLVAVSCFVAFPLQAIFVRPETTGLPGLLFELLGGFDKPFNQAPSLHIALLVVIWDHLRGRLPGIPRLVWHAWCFLIGASVLTTWQHHVIDIPTGMLLGLFAAWLFPRETASPLARFRRSADPKSRRLTVCYAAGALAFLVLSIVGIRLTPAALMLLWPALALSIVAIGYLGAGPRIFQKRRDGRASIAGRWLMAPYRLGVRVNIWFWTRTLPASTEIADGVHLGRFPDGRADGFAAVIDMTGELCAPRRPGWHAIPTLDLLPLDETVLKTGAMLVETARSQGPVLVCCALGFQRSAAVVARWLLATGRAANATEAIRMLERSGCRVHLRPELIAFEVEHER